MSDKKITDTFTVTTLAGDRYELEITLDLSKMREVAYDLQWRANRAASKTATAARGLVRVKVLRKI